jgi:hypothetical protein
MPIFTMNAFEESIFRGELMPVLKLGKDNENKEIEFEHGYRKSAEIVKRT